jgi:hypothetical protein
MLKKRKDETSRYDLPSSRILIRAQRARARRLREAVGPEPAQALQLEMDARILRMIRDLFVVRLLEDRRALPDRYLCGGRRSRPLEPGEAGERLTAMNGWAGFELFDLEAWRSLGPGRDLAALYHEMQLARFWPPRMPIEILGALWEEGLPGARRSGVYYTPRNIVNIVMEEAMTGLFAERNQVPVRVLDPACGAGYFLLEAFRRLLDRELGRYQRRGDLFAPLRRGESGQMVLDPVRRMELINEHLFGVDIDETALELARRALLVETLSDTPALAGPAPGHEPLFKNLREGDSILEKRFPQQANLFDAAAAPPLKPFLWHDSETGFGRIVQEGFTCVIGNPPWVSLKGRHRQIPYSPDVVEHLIQRYRADTYRPNMVEFFIRKSIELLAENGWHSFVVPDRIAENEQYAALRQFMIERGEITRLHFREPFPGVAADTLVYVFTRREKPRRSLRIRLTDHAGRSLDVPQTYWLKGEGYAPAPAGHDEVEEILKKIETAGRRRLSQFLETGVGFIARPRRISADKVSENQQPVIKGEHVAPYQRTGSAWFEFTLQNLAGGTRSLPKLTRKDRILLRKTGARLTAAKDETGHLPEQSLYFAFPRDRRLARPYHLNYFLAILNSRVMSFYFRHRKITNRATTPQIKKVHLDTLPIRPINFRDPEAKKFHDDLAAMVQQREAATDRESARELDRKMEKIIADLYNLSPQDLQTIFRETAKGWE